MQVVHGEWLQPQQTHLSEGAHAVGRNAWLCCVGEAMILTVVPPFVNAQLVVYKSNNYMVYSL